MTTEASAGFQRPRYFTNLDSLRGMAALAVVFYHLANWIPYPADTPYSGIRAVFSLNGQGGQMGVRFFFVLSGFLITYLMMLERQDKGSLNIRDFYIRRALRIWPLYFLTLAVGFILYPLLQHYAFHETLSDLSKWYRYVFFLANFDYLMPPGPPNGIVGVHWSVAVEEQFYLVWPLLFVLVPSRWFPYACGILALLSFSFFQANTDRRIVTYFHTFACVSSLAIGALLACLAYSRPLSLQHLLKRIPVWAGVMTYIGGLAMVCYKGRLIEQIGVPKLAYEFATILFFAWVIADQTFNPKPAIAFGRIRFLDQIGKFSYGLYLLHIIAIIITIRICGLWNVHPFVQTGLALILALLISYLSFRYFEAPFNAMRKRFSRISH